MNNIYAVDKYCDQIRVKTKRELNVLGEEKYHYFDTETEARKFIRDRAHSAYVKAEGEAQKAWRRAGRVNKKFAFRLDTDPKSSVS